MPEVMPDTKKDHSSVTKAEKRAAKKEAKNPTVEKKRIRKEGKENAKTRRSNDGTWVKKGNRLHFGDKIHSLQGTEMPFIRVFVVTKASLHDS